jgi:hypothetical protein
MIEPACGEFLGATESACLLQALAMWLSLPVVKAERTSAAV